MDHPRTTDSHKWSKVFRPWCKDELQTLPPSFISDNRAAKGTNEEGNDSNFIFTACYDSFKPKSENTIIRHFVKWAMTRNRTFVDTVSAHWPVVS